MSDLISRKQAIQRMIEEVETSKKNAIHINEIKRLLQDVDAIESVPVVHGEWILRHIGVGHMWECSVCHKRPDIYVKNDTNFCPNCGADMREVGAK